MHVAVPVPLLYLHGSLRPVPLVIVVCKLVPVLSLLLGVSSHLWVVHNDGHSWLCWLGCSGVVLGLCPNVLLAVLFLCCHL